MCVNIAGDRCIVVLHESLIVQSVIYIRLKNLFLASSKRANDWKFFWFDLNYWKSCLWRKDILLGLWGTFQDIAYASNFRNMPWDEGLPLWRITNQSIFGNYFLRKVFWVPLPFLFLHSLVSWQSLPKPLLSFLPPAPYTSQVKL